MDYQWIAESQLFSGISPKEVQEMLTCLESRVQTYQKGEYIYHMGEHTGQIGLVLSGSVNIENSDIWGNCSILDNVAPGNIFAEAYACSFGEPLMVDVVAAQDTEILLLHVEKILKTCPTACVYHSRLIRNLLMVMASKNLGLTRKINHISPKTIRGKLSSYLSTQAQRQNSNEFTIPFNRQQLADYLGVDRSAMSHELSKMQKEGLLIVQKNRFYVKEKLV